MAEAGTYGAGVPDPDDTASVGGGSPSFGSFDDLSMYGVSPNLANLEVPVARNVKRMRPVMTSGKTPEAGNVQAYPYREQEELVPLEKITYENAVVSLYKKDPNNLSSLQLALAAGGFYGKKADFIPQTPDQKTRNAWDQVIKIAMRQEKTIDEVIDEAVQSNGGLEEGLKKHGVGPEASQPKQVRISHPDDIRMVARQASTQVLGRGWNNEQIENFVKTYQAMESAAGSAEGQYVDAPSVEAAAMTAAEKSDPRMATATRGNAVMDMVIKSFSILGGGSSE